MQMEISLVEYLWLINLMGNVRSIIRMEGSTRGVCCRELGMD